MKNKLAAAIAALAIAPAAQAVETDVYLQGNIAFSGSYFDTDNGSVADVKNNASHVGIYASATEGSLRAFVVYERGFDRYNPNTGNEDSQDAVRAFFGGVSGDFGTVILGRARSDYRIAGEWVDPFYDTAIVGFTGNLVNGTTFREGANYGLSNLTNGYSDNSVIYRSRDISGFRFNAAVYANDNTETSAAGDKHDYGAGVAYQLNSLISDGDELAFDLQYLSINNLASSGVPFDPAASVGGSPGESSNTRFTARYAKGRDYSVGLSLENVDVDAEPEARLYSYLSGTFALSDKTHLAAGFGHLDFEPVRISGNGLSIGVFHNIMDNVQAYAAARFVDYDETVNGTDSTTVFAVGASYSFEVNLD